MIDPTPQQAKHALMRWAEEADVASSIQRSKFGRVALAAGAGFITLNALLSRRGGKTGGRLLGLAGLMGLAKSAAALTPIAVKAYTMAQLYKQSRESDGDSSAHSSR